MVNWINIDGLSNTKLLEDIGTGFNIHSLTLEDILTFDQRPKLENHEDYFYIVLKMIHWDDATADMEVEQVSLLLPRKVVLSFQEKPGDVFDPLRKRLRRGTGRTRKQATDYIVYSLMDAIVDNHFNVFLTTVICDNSATQVQLHSRRSLISFHPESGLLILFQRVKYHH